MLAMAHYSAEALRALLRKRKTATLDELKQALGTNVDMTVFRKLAELAYRSSYSHGGATTRWTRLPASTSWGSGRTGPHGSLATARCWRPWKPSCAQRRRDTLRTNSKRAFTSRSRHRSGDW